MKEIKFLQYATAGEVLAIVLLGLYIVLFSPGTITVYGQVCGAISPFLLPQIAASFAGNPLERYIEQRVEAIKARKANGG